MELLRLRDEEKAISYDTKMIAEENQVLRDIMLAHGISPPERQLRPISPMATVTVIGDKGKGQRLHVSGLIDSGLCPEVFPAGFEISEDNTKEPLDLTGLSISPIAGSSSVSDSQLEPLQDYFGAPAQPLGLVPEINPLNQNTKSHPAGLDATQVGVDFVLL
jgi:hypothetical protein